MCLPLFFALMSTNAPVHLLSPEEIAARQATEIAQLRLPDTGSLFSERAVRLRQLAAGHPMRDYLIFMADLADAQQTALREPVTLPLPTQEQLGDAARNGVAPLATGLWRRTTHWRDDLARVTGALLPRLPHGPARDVVAGLAQASADHLDHQADRLASGVMLGLDLGTAPLIGAALQVHHARLVAQTQAAYPDLAFGRVDDATLCPCCGSRPTSSIVRLGGDAPARYLHCSLCESEWHMVRIKCAHCEGTRSISYQELEAATPGDGMPEMPRGAVRAECCDECHHYLKIVAQDRDAQVDPVADDLASVTLDLLVSESGLERHGVNLLLLFGDDSAASATENTTAGAGP